MRNDALARTAGPFFLVMAALVVADAACALPLGSYGWAILGVTAVAGNAVIWWLSERTLGRCGASAPPPYSLSTDFDGLIAASAGCGRGATSWIDTGVSFSARKPRCVT